VGEVYGTRFGAEVRSFAPVLVSLHDAAGDIIAAAGYRPAQGSRLFLERYLDEPVDGPLACARAGIVEVGHLAASRPGDGPAAQGSALILSFRDPIAGRCLAAQSAATAAMLCVAAAVGGADSPRRGARRTTHAGL
jgi:hypothetical protein